MFLSCYRYPLWHTKRLVLPQWPPWPPWRGPPAPLDRRSSPRLQCFSIYNSHASLQCIFTPPEPALQLACSRSVSFLIWFTKYLALLLKFFGNQPLSLPLALRRLFRTRLCLAVARFLTGGGVLYSISSGLRLGATFALGFEFEFEFESGSVWVRFSFCFFFFGLYFCLFIKMGISSDGSRSKGADKRLPDIWRAGCKDAGKGVGMLMMMMPQFNAPYEISFRFGTNWILLFGSSLPGCGCRRGLSTRRYTRLKEPT